MHRLLLSARQSQGHLGAAYPVLPPGPTRAALAPARLASARLATFVAILAVNLSLAAVSVAHAWQIGHRVVTWQDPARSNRSIQTDVYYPADAAGENVPIGGDGSVLFPVVAFGHGFVMPVSVYTYVWTALAPAGYIVALPRTESGFLPSHSEFGRDLAFLADRIRVDGGDPGSFLYGKVALTAAVAGHSMGGGASILAAAGSTTINAVWNLAAANTNPSAIDAAPAVTAPVLMFSGSLDCVTPPGQHQAPIYAALGSACKTRVTLEGASHCQFAEPNFNCGLGETGCPGPTLTREEQHALTVLLALPWLAATLRGDQGAWGQFQELLGSTVHVTAEQACQVAGASGPDPGLEPGPGLGPGGSAGGSCRVTLSATPNPLVRTGGSGATFTLRLGKASPVTLEVFDAAGRRVRLVYEGRLAAGPHRIRWDLRDEAGRAVPAGTLYARVRTVADSRGVPLVVLR